MILVNFIAFFQRLKPAGFLFLLQMLVVSLLALSARVNAGDFTYTAANGAITITGYTGPGGALAIPNTIDGLPVASIGDNAFWGKSGLTSVTIPSTVTSIGRYAFSYCNGLTGITVEPLNPNYSSLEGVLFNKNQTTLVGFPGGKAENYPIPGIVTSIGDYAFYGCSGLTGVTIPNSVTSIGSFAFLGCGGLTGVSIPSNVTSIGVDSFSSCWNLLSVTVDTLNPAYSGLEGVLFNKNQTTLVRFPGGKAGNYTIPNSVTSIGNSAFSGCGGLTGVTIPNSVTSIGNFAFQSCRSLTSISIPSSVTSIEYYAFSYCAQLASVSFMGNAPIVGYRIFDSAATAFKVYYFNGRAGFTSPLWNGYPSEGLAAPDIVLEQPAGAGLAGGGVRDFGSVAMGDWIIKVFSIRNTGDLELSGLTISKDGADSGDFTVGLPGAATLAPGASTTFSISFSPLATGFRSAAIHVASNSPDKNPFNFVITGFATPPPPFTYTNNGSAITITGYTGSGENVTMPGTINGLPVTAIAANAFQNNSMITGMTIPGGVISIGDQAFGGCTGLTGVYFQGGAPALGSSVFLGNVTAKVFYLPGTAGWGATFGGLSTVPVTYTYTSANGEITITGYTGGGGAVWIPGMINSLPVTHIGAWAFARNGSVTSVTIPQGVISIGDRAFYQCSNLTAVTMPASLTSIGEGAFYFLNGLAGVTIPSGVTSIGDLAFAACGGLTAITVDAANPVFSSADGVLFNISKTTLIQFPAGRTGPYTVPASVNEIGGLAFYHCGGLTSVALPVGLVRIGIGGFQSCSGLNSVVIPFGVTTIEDQAFSGCSGLTSLVIPGSVTTIGSQAFASCSGLMSVTLSASVTSIGQMAFVGCGGLTIVDIPAGVTEIGSYAFYGSGLVRANFLGNAPVIGTGVFDATDSGFAVSFLTGASGFTSPLWGGYPTVDGNTISQLTTWLLANGFPANSDLKSDANGDGVNLLLAYGLNLDPRLNLSGSMPKPVLAGNQMRLVYFAGNGDVAYKVEASSDLKTWSVAGVSISAPDANQFRTATVTISGPRMYLRLCITH